MNEQIKITSALMYGNYENKKFNIYTTISAKWVGDLTSVKFTIITRGNNNETHLVKFTCQQVTVLKICKIKIACYGM